LELYDLPKERVEFLAKHIEFLKVHERMYEDRFKSGAGAKADLLRVRYLRLDAEIQLLRAKREADKTSSAQDTAGTGDKDKLQGNWMLVSTTKAGKMHEPKQVTLTFKGDKLRIAKVGEDETTSWRRPSRSTRLKSPRR
jgi:hypothetical protein